MSGSPPVTMQEWMRDVQRRLALLERRRTFASQVPAGAVVAFAGGDPPPGWLLCDGGPLPPGHERLEAVLGSRVLPLPLGPGSWLVKT